MGIFSSIADIFSGGIVGAVSDAIQAYFPPGMSAADKAKMTMAVRQAEMEHERQVLKLAHQAEAEFDKRLAEHEGTAADLKALPVFGPVLIFLRGCQRPAWGFGALAVDWMVFSGGWDVALSRPLGGWTPQGTALVAVNVLVLGFLFGERAVKNVMPLVTRMLDARAGR